MIKLQKIKSNVVTGNNKNDLKKRNKERHRDVRNKSKCSWNPLKFFGEKKLQKIKEEKTIIREKLQKRLVLLEKRLSYINGKIDKCENLKQDCDRENSIPHQPILRTIAAYHPEHHDFRTKSLSGYSQNYMAIAKERIRKKSEKNCAYSKSKSKNRERGDGSEKNNRPVKPDRKSGTRNKINLCEKKSSLDIDIRAENTDDVLVQTPCTYSRPLTEYPVMHVQVHSDNEKHTDNSVTSESIDSETQTVSAKEQSGQDIETIIDWEQYCNQTTKGPKATSRQSSQDLVNERKIKSIINEAVDECLGKSLKKFFEDGLEGYIKKRIESVVKTYSFVNPVIQRIASNYSFDQEYAPKENRVTVKGSVISQVPALSVNPSRPANLRSVRNKYGKEIRALPSKNSFKPHSAPSFCKDVISTTSQLRNKSQNLPRHSQKATVPFQRKQRGNVAIN